MSAPAAPVAVRIPRMAKKRPTGETRKTHRVNVGVPEEWHAVMRRLAAKRQQPVLYLLIALAKAEAEKLGVKDVPAPPWEESGGE